MSEPQKDSRDVGSGITLVVLTMAASCFAWRYGLVVGAGVYLIVLALGSEIQRKTNQIMDILEERFPRR